MFMSAGKKKIKSDSSSEAGKEQSRSPELRRNSKEFEKSAAPKNTKAVKNNKQLGDESEITDETTI
jgi:hypothetical protein